MKGYLVDPFAKTVTEVETSGYPHFKDLINVNIIDAVTIAVDQNGNRDTVWVDDEGLYVENQAYFTVSAYAQPLAGKAILLGTNKEGETTSAFMDFYTFKSLVSFPNIELDHMESIPEGTKEYSPVLEKELPVVGTYPVFRQKSETEETKSDE